MTPLLTKWREQEEEFDKRFSNGSNYLCLADESTKVSCAEDVKSHLRQSLIAIIEGEKERMKETHLCRFNDGDCSCECYLSAIQDQISYYQSTLEGLKKL